MTEIGEELIAQSYSAMLDSVWLINAIISGERMSSESEENKKECIERNVVHLKLMRSKDDWTTEDMTVVDAAIVKGEAYI